MAAIQPAQVVRDAITVMRMDLDFRRRLLDLRLGADLPEIMGDARKLTQVLVNLMRNAIHATNSGDSLVVEAFSNGSGGVVLAVEDPGSGIPAEIRAHLFEPFMTSKGEGGMGMGLYMARLVAESHGGRITCSDRPGGGTRFEIVIESVV
jgi:signal transduction histidine kinase